MNRILVWVIFLSLTLAYVHARRKKCSGEHPQGCNIRCIEPNDEGECECNNDCQQCPDQNLECDKSCNAWRNKQCVCRESTREDKTCLPKSRKNGGKRRRGQRGGQGGQK